MATAELRWWEGGGEGRPGKSFRYFAFLPDPIAGQRFPLDPLAPRLAELEGELAALASLPGLAPALPHLLAVEALASARLAGRPVSPRRLYRSRLRPGLKTDPVVGPALRCLGALERLREERVGAGASSPGELLFLHRALTAGEPEAGRLRSEQTWVGGSRASPRTADFIPPSPERVRPLVDDLAAFLRRSDLSPLAKGPLALLQLLTVRPFRHGNGRLARLLLQRVLVGKAAGPGPVLPLSSVFWIRPGQLSEALLAFREGRVGAAVESFLVPVRLAAGATRRFTRALALLEEQRREWASLFRSHSSATGLLAELRTHGLLDVKRAAGALGRSGEAARLALRSLTEVGFLRQVGPGRRNRLWEAVGFFPLLDRLEQNLLRDRDGEWEDGEGG